jgi:hypothetical protein
MSNVMRAIICGFTHVEGHDWKWVVGVRSRATMYTGWECSRCHWKARRLPMRWPR